MPRPDEPLVELFHAPLKDYPEHGPGTFRYPRPRKRKGEPASPEELAAGIFEAPVLGGDLPRNVLWPFNIRAGPANSRTTAVSPQFQGPAVLVEISLLVDDAADSGGGISLFISEDSSGQVQDDLTLAVPTGTPVFAPISYMNASLAFNDAVRTALDALQASANIGEAIKWVYRLNYIYSTAGPFFLKTSIRTSGAVLQGSKGGVLVSQYPTLDALRASLR